MLSAWSKQVYHRTECFFRRQYFRLFLSSGLSLCLRSCPLRSTLATSASIPLSVQKFSHRHTFNTIFCLLHGFIRFQGSTAKCFIYTYCSQPWGVSDIPIILRINTSSFSDSSSARCFLTPSPSASANIPHTYLQQLATLQQSPETTGQFATFQNLSLLVTLTPTTNHFFLASSRNFQRHRGAWVLTL